MKINKNHQEFTGQLRRTKQRKSLTNWANDWFATILEDLGRRKTRYYPDNVYILIPKKDDKILMITFKRTPKSLSEIQDKALIRFSGLLEPWNNKLGGCMKNLKLLEVISGVHGKEEDAPT